MAHIPLPEGLPGIVGPMAAYPETAKHLRALAETLLRGPNTLTSAEREMIAAHVSYRNECNFCQLSHSAAAAAHLGGDIGLIDRVKVNPENGEVSDKMKALLNVAGKVQIDGKRVSTDDVARARQHGATDKEIHDTVLIAAAFSMYNRYVDGLATTQPLDPAAYREMGESMAHEGYLRSERAPAQEVA